MIYWARVCASVYILAPCVLCMCAFSVRERECSKFVTSTCTCSTLLCTQSLYICPHCHPHTLPCLLRSVWHSSIFVSVCLYTFIFKCLTTPLCVFEITLCHHYCVAQAPPRPHRVLQRAVAVALSAGAGRLLPASPGAPLCHLPAGSNTRQDPQPWPGNWLVHWAEALTHVVTHRNGAVDVQH